MAGPYLLGSSSLRSTNTCMPFVCSGSKLHPKSSNFTPFRNGHLPPATKLTHWTMVLEFGPRVIWAYNRQASRRCFQRRRFHLKKNPLAVESRQRARENSINCVLSVHIASLARKLLWKLRGKQKLNFGRCMCRSVNIRISVNGEGIRRHVTSDWNKS